MKLQCHQVRKLLVGYVYEELPEDRRAQVDHHLADCPGCRDEFDECHQILRTIDEATLHRCQPAPTAGLLQRINWELDSRPHLYRRRRIHWISTRWLALAACILFGLVGAFFLSTQLNDWFSTLPVHSTGGPSASDAGVGGVFNTERVFNNQPNWRMLHQGGSNNQLPAIEAELDRITGRSPLLHPYSSGQSEVSSSGSVKSSTPESSAKKSSAY